MDIIKKYEKAAKSWNQKVNKLGYSSAYNELFNGRVSQHGRVLDVGTGTGTFAISWVVRGGSKDLTLLDPSLRMLQQAKDNFAKYSLIPDIVESKLENFRDYEKFDVVLASHIIEHFQEPLEALYILAELVRPGGQLFLNVSKPHWCNWIIWMRYRHRWYSPKKVEVMAHQVGLSINRVHKYQTGPPSRTSIGYILTKVYNQ